MLDILRSIFSGIVEVMSGVTFFGLTWWQWCIGLSFLGIAIDIFHRFFFIDGSSGGDEK